MKKGILYQEKYICTYKYINLYIYIIYRQDRMIRRPFMYTVACVYKRVRECRRTQGNSSVDANIEDSNKGKKVWDRLRRQRITSGNSAGTGPADCCTAGPSLNPFNTESIISRKSTIIEYTKYHSDNKLPIRREIVIYYSTRSAESFIVRFEIKMQLCMYVCRK